MSGRHPTSLSRWFRRPEAFWLTVIVLLLLVSALAGSLFLKERAARTLLTERALRYAVEAHAIDQAYERRTAEENARRSASMQ